MPSSLAIASAIPPLAVPSSLDELDDARSAAPDALTDALADWASNLAEAGVRRSDGARYFPSRQMDRTMRQAHREGVLFERLTE
jgi:hypothetical protein